MVTDPYIRIICSSSDPNRRISSEIELKTLKVTKLL